MHYQHAHEDWGLIYHELCWVAVPGHCLGIVEMCVIKETSSSMSALTRHSGKLRVEVTMYHPATLAA